jgi:hypothetical protein
MKKIIVLAGFYLGLWGILGFFATILLGFLSCCAGLSKEIYLVLLLAFVLTAIVMAARSIFKEYKGHTGFQH